MIERADLLGEPQGVVERQRIHERPEAQSPRSLRGEREEDRGRGRHAERRRVVLGDVQGVETEPVIRLGELEAVLDLLGERTPARVDVVEDAEFHHPAPSGMVLQGAKRSFRRTLVRRKLFLRLGQKPVQPEKIVPKAFVPIPSAAVSAKVGGRLGGNALDSPSLHSRPNPAFPVTVPAGAWAKSADPRRSRMPSPVPGANATLFWIVVDWIWIEVRVLAITPAPTLPVISASRIASEEPRKPEMPPCDAELPLPVILLTLVRPKFTSPICAELMRRLIPVPVFPETVFPPTMSTLALVRLIPLPALLLIVFIPTKALAPKTMWTPFTTLPLIVLPPALLALSIPMRAEPPSNTPTPCRPF